MARTAGPEGSDAAKAAAGIRAILKGELEQFSMEYPCHSANEHRWFFCRASRFPSQVTRHAFPILW